MPDIDLAVVTVPETGRRAAAATASAGSGWRACTPSRSTTRPSVARVLTVRGQRTTSFAYRYESWVQFRTRAVRAAVDLAALAERLTAQEADGGRDRVVGGRGGVRPDAHAGHRAGGVESALERGVVRAAIEEHLRTAPPAWDPYAITR